MAKYRIYWDLGHGSTNEVIDAESEQEAVNAAYEAAREEFELSADYGAQLLSDDKDGDE